MMNFRILMMSFAVITVMLCTGSGKHPEPTKDVVAVVKPEPLKTSGGFSEIKVTPVKETKVSQDVQSLIDAQERINFFSAKFNLLVKDKEKGNIQLDASGILWMANNRRYRVEYQEPKKQLLISNGKKRWLYLEEINQVQVQAMPPEGNPAELFLELGGGLSRLLRLCDVTLEKENEYMRYSLIPRNEQKTDFEKVMLWTKGEDKIPVKLKVIGEKIIQVDFEMIKNKLGNEKIVETEGSLFEFIYPKNVEVIEMFW